MIFVEGSILKELPNSKKTLPLILDRSYGINKIYDLNSMKDINKITTYYVNTNSNYSYYIPVTTITNNNDEKVKIIIEKLKSSPTYDTNLVSYLASSTLLQKYEILENSVNLSFNNEILSLDDNRIMEEVKYSIALSIKDTYGINETIFYIDDNLVDCIIL
jgi:germination protein M